LRRAPKTRSPAGGRILGVPDLVIWGREQLIKREEIDRKERRKTKPEAKRDKKGDRGKKVEYGVQSVSVKRKLKTETEGKNGKGTKGKALTGGGGVGAEPFEINRFQATGGATEPSEIDQLQKL